MRRLRGDVPRWSHSADGHLPEARFLDLVLICCSRRSWRTIT